MKSSLLKSSSIAAVLAAAVILASTAFAEESQYHGTECMTANLAQGQLFSWNKDGITNNSGTALFIICPMTYDRDELGAFATPRGRIRASAFYPANFPNGQSINCLVRVGSANDTGAQGSDDQSFSVNLSFNIGSQNFFGTGENDTAISSAFDMSTSVNNSAHLLCLMPGGSTFRKYALDISE